MDFHSNTLEPDGLNSKHVQMINISLFQLGVLIKCNDKDLESKNEIIEDFTKMFVWFSFYGLSIKSRNTYKGTFCRENVS